MDNEDWGDGTSTYTLTVNTVSTDAAGKICGKEDSRTMRVDKHARAPGASDHCCHMYVHPILKTGLKNGGLNNAKTLMTTPPHHHLRRGRME